MTGVQSLMHHVTVTNKWPRAAQLILDLFRVFFRQCPRFDRNFREFPHLLLGCPYLIHPETRLQSHATGCNKSLQWPTATQSTPKTGLWKFTGLTAAETTKKSKQSPSRFEMWQISNHAQPRICFRKCTKKYTWLRNCFFSWRKHMLIMPSACEYRIHSSSARFASLLPNGSSLKWGPRDQPFSYLKSTKNETLCTADEIMIIIIYYHIYQMLAGNLH